MEGGEPVLKKSKESEGDERPLIMGEGAALKRQRSVYIWPEDDQEETKEKQKKKLYDWHAAWVSFVGTCNGGVNYHYNFHQKGAWAAMRMCVVPRMEEIVRNTCTTLVRERHTPVHLKTILPAHVGGMAGGTKFFVQNLFFKFATDDLGMYGGDNGCDVQGSSSSISEGDVVSGKAAAAELKNLSFVSNLCLGQLRFCNVRRVWHHVHNHVDVITPELRTLHVPLACVCRVRGYTVIVTCTLPVQGAVTLRYGSDDGGITVVDGENDAEIRKCAEMLANAMRLKKHHVGPKPTVPGAVTPMLHLACDVELHRGNDGRIWLLDAARLVPCNPPGKVRQKILYEFFKAEFVVRYGRMYGVYVSSDAWSGFNRHTSRLQDNKEVETMYQVYLFEEIPRVAKQCDEWCRRKNNQLKNNKKGKNHQNDYFSVFLLSRIRETVNARHLGRVMALLDVENRVGREILLRDLVFRSVKGLLRRRQEGDDGKEEELISLDRVCRSLESRFFVEVTEDVKSKVLEMLPHIIKEATELVNNPQLKFIASLTFKDRILDEEEEEGNEEEEEEETKRGLMLQRGETIPTKEKKEMFRRAFIEGFNSVIEPWNCGDDAFVQNALKTALRDNFLE